MKFWTWECVFHDQLFLFKLSFYHDLYLGLLTLIGKSWKTHPEIFLKFSFSGSSHRPFYWKTHPFFFSKIQLWGVTQTVLLENSSIRFFWLKPYMICNIWSGWVFQKNGLCDALEMSNWWLDEFSSKTASEISHWRK